MTKRRCAELESIINKLISDKNVKLIPLTKKEVYCLALINTLYEQGVSSSMEIYRRLINQKH